MGRKEHSAVPAILLKFAEALGAEVKNRRLQIPEALGRGYCAGFVFNEHIRMIVSNYELNEDMVVANPDFNTTGRTIFFKFQNVFPSSVNDLKAMPSVLIATSRLSTEEFVEIHSNTAVINIEVDADYLHGLFDFSAISPVLQSLLLNTQPLLFEQILYPALQQIADELVSNGVGEVFELFFLRIKAEELICRLLIELEKRDEKQLLTLNQHDIQSMYKVKAKMLADLSSPPLIQELATEASMSPTKLKRLFKQIFGDSIFSYYQNFRMQEAARLLKDEKLSVSEAGYRMGFTNLSHFSRVFQEHIGMKPKQYSLSSF